MNAGLQQWLGDLINVQLLEVLSEGPILRVNLTYQIRRTAETRTEQFTRRVA
jgi:hypothetical protein